MDAEVAGTSGIMGLPELAGMARYLPSYVSCCTIEYGYQPDWAPENSERVRPMCHYIGSLALFIVGTNEPM